MHVLAKCSSLLENLSIVERAIPVRTTMPVINGILLQAREKSLFFASTNLDLSIESSNSDVQIKREGSVVLPGKLVDILRQLPGEEVEISADPENNRTTVSSGKAVFFLYGMDHDEFPAFTPPEEWQGWSHLTFDAEEFRQIFRRVIFAVSSDESKPPFRGILIEKNEHGVMTCLASDTYRMACLQKQMPAEKKGDSFRLLVPGKNLHELLRIMDRADGLVTVYFNEREIVFIYQYYTFISRLLEDRYPNLINAFPAEYKTRIIVQASALEKTISRAALLAQSYNNMIALQIEDNLLKVKAGSEMGRMDDEMELISKEGDDLAEIMVNARYFIEPLRIMGKEDLKIDFNGYLGPCIFKSGSEEEHFLFRYLVLPIKIDKKTENPGQGSS